MSINPVPDEFAGVTPQLTVSDADAAVAFYVEAFGADETVRTHAGDGRVLHCELLLAGGRVLLHDEFPEMAQISPTTLGGTTVNLHLYVPDVDAAYACAIGAGATSVMEPQDAFWGDRYAMITDPFGHCWSLASQREDLSADQLAERVANWTAETGGDPTV